MTTEHGMGTGTVHEVRWRDALPWWIIFRAAGAAFGPTVILLAGLGSLATWAGWSLADRFGLAVADPTAAVLAGAGGDPLVLPPPQPRVAPGQPAATALGLPAGWLTAAVGRLPPVAAELARLVRLPFDPRAGVRDAGGGLVRLGWFVLVWSIFGTAITRRVALSLVSEEVPGLTGAVWYGARKWLPAFNSFLFVLLGIAVLSVPGAALGLFMRTDVGVAVAGVVWPLVLAGAAVLAILLVGLVAGWPLMVAAVGVERGDSFQAISTAFSYLYQRPLHYAFYATVAAVVAVPAMAMASLFGGLTVTLADWAASFGMGHERAAAVAAGLAAAGGAGAWGGRAIAFWRDVVGGLAGAFVWGHTWACATAIYLLLRQDVDGTELDEVVLDEPGGEPAAA